MFKHRRKKGFIAIISLLIIATISMTVSMSLLKNGVDNAALSLYSINYESAKMNSVVCLEDTLLRIKQEDQFARDLDYTIADSNGCTTNIQWQTPVPNGVGTIETLVDLTVTGTSENFSRSFVYELKVTKKDVNRLDSSLDYLNNISIISINEIST